MSKLEEIYNEYSFGDLEFIECQVDKMCCVFLQILKFAFYRKEHLMHMQKIRDFAIVKVS